MLRFLTPRKGSNDGQFERSPEQQKVFLKKKMEEYANHQLEIHEGAVGRPSYALLQKIERREQICKLYAEDKQVTDEKMKPSEWWEKMDEAGLWEGSTSHEGQEGAGGSSTRQSNREQDDEQEQC